jgi:hypothetical protein
MTTGGRSWRPTLYPGPQLSESHPGVMVGFPGSGFSVPPGDWTQEKSVQEDSTFLPVLQYQSQQETVARLGGRAAPCCQVSTESPSWALCPQAGVTINTDL